MTLAVVYDVPLTEEQLQAIEVERETLQREIFARLQHLDGKPLTEMYQNQIKGAIDEYFREKCQYEYSVRFEGTEVVIDTKRDL